MARQRILFQNICNQNRQAVDRLAHVRHTCGERHLGMLIDMNHLDGAIARIAQFNKSVRNQTTTLHCADRQCAVPVVQAYQG